MDLLSVLKKQTTQLIVITYLAIGAAGCAKKQVAATTTQPATTQTTSTSDANTTDYESYVGSYETQLQQVGTAQVTVENNKLYGQSAGSPKTQLIPEGKDIFRVEGMNATVTFTRDNGQKVTGLVITVDGNEIRGEKVK